MGCSEAAHFSVHRIGAAGPEQIVRAKAIRKLFRCSAQISPASLVRMANTTWCQNGAAFAHLHVERVIARGIIHAHGT
jgi:hypothetical protein